jgi:hypothetical protein
VKNCAIYVSKNPDLKKNYAAKKYGVKTNSKHQNKS